MKLKLKAKISKKLFDATAFEAAVETGLDVSVAKVQQSFLKTVQTWKSGRSFKFAPEKRRFQRIIGTDSEQYARVTEGTKPQTIRPKRRKFLRFTVPFGPKTQPGVIGSTSGSRGGTVVFARVVNHPGIKARKFEDAIAEEAEGYLAQDVQQAINDAADRM